MRIIHEYMQFGSIIRLDHLEQSTITLVGTSLPYRYVFVSMWWWCVKCMCVQFKDACAVFTTCGVGIFVSFPERFQRRKDCELLKSVSFVWKEDASSLLLLAASRTATLKETLADSRSLTAKSLPGFEKQESWSPDGRQLRLQQRDGRGGRS